LIFISERFEDKTGEFEGAYALHDLDQAEKNV